MIIANLYILFTLFYSIIGSVIGEEKQINNFENSNENSITSITKLLKGAADSLLSILKITDSKLDDSSTTIDSKNIDDILYDAKLLIANGSIQESLDVLLSIVKHSPDHQECNSLLGAVLLGVNQSSLAEGFLYSASKLSNWTDVVSVANLAESLRINGDIDLAQKLLVKGYNAINKTDSSGIIIISFGDIHYEKKNYTAAAELYLEAAFRKPYNIEQWMKASTLQFPLQLRDYVFAENVLLEGIKNNPNSSVLIQNLGLVLHLTDRTEEAINFYQEALRLDNNNYNVLSPLATALHSLEKNDDALKFYMLAEKYDSNNIIMLANFAILLCQVFSKQDKNSAILIQRGYSIDPTSSDIEKAKTFCEFKF